MADVEFERGEQSFNWRLEPGQVQQMVNWAGALTSLVLVIGVGIWGYRLTMRDVNGVPVIKALQGPMRIAPQDPGGQIAQDEGMAVNSIAAGKPDKDLPSRVILAPAPIGLSAADQPAKAAPQGAQDASGSGAVPAQTAAAPGADGQTAAANGAPDAAGQAQPSDQTSDQPTDPNDPVSVALAAAQAAAMAAQAAQAGPQMGGAVVTSPRPQLRPGEQLMADAAAVKPAAVPVKDVDPASLRPGTHLVQLGAYDDPASAKAAWQKLAQRFGGLMDGKGRVVQKASVGGRGFYRLRAQGFPTEADARRFCAALLGGGGTACVPVVFR